MKGFATNRFDVHGQMAKPAFSCADSVVAIEHASISAINSTVTF
jgi:hypothetical protein